MKKGQTSKRGGIQDILFPMEYMNITQGNNGQYSHQERMLRSVVKIQVEIYSMLLSMYAALRQVIVIQREMLRFGNPLIRCVLPMVQ